MTCPRYALKILENATDGMLRRATPALRRDCGEIMRRGWPDAAAVRCGSLTARTSGDREGLRRLLVPRGCFLRHGPPARPGLLPYGRLLGFAPARRFCLAHARSPCGSPGVRFPGWARRGIFHCRRRIVKAP